MFCSNTLFKFVHNTAKPGSLYESDYAGKKAAGLELKGALYIEYANVPGLACPIQCVVDYAGCRVLAKVTLQLSQQPKQVVSALLVLCRRGSHAVMLCMAAATLA